jgi:CYTH domain-containing protein
MPVENERKYVLTKQHQFKWLTKSPDFVPNRIRQGYLSDQVRLRATETPDEEKYEFTFKRMGVVGPGKGYKLIEIEQRISKEDFEALWPFTERRLVKIRGKEYDPDTGLTWEIDHFYHDEMVYFVMAEVELSEDSDGPGELPKFIADHLIYEVPYGDPRFFNTQLGDHEKTSALYDELLDDYLTGTLSTI